MPITYPVPSDARFVVYLTRNEAIDQKGIPWPNRKGEPLIGGDPAYGLAIIVEVPDPPYDPATEKLVPTETLDTVNKEYLVSSTVQPLTVEELDELANQKAIEGEAAAIKSMVVDLRAGAGLDAERIARLELATAHLLSEVLGIKETVVAAGAPLPIKNLQ